MKRSTILIVFAALIITAVAGLTLTPQVYQPTGEETKTATTTTTPETSVYEQRYLDTATKVDLKDIQGWLEVTVVRYGLYTYIPSEAPRREATGFRVDLMVKNIGTLEERGFLIFETTLMDNLGRQYDMTYTALDVEAVQPARLATGYIVFELPDKDVSKLTLTIPDGYDSYFRLFFQFTLNLK